MSLCLSVSTGQHDPLLVAGRDRVLVRGVQCLAVSIALRGPTISFQLRVSYQDILPRIADTNSIVRA